MSIRALVASQSPRSNRITVGAAATSRLAYTGLRAGLRTPALYPHPPRRNPATVALRRALSLRSGRQKDAKRSGGAEEGRKTWDRKRDIQQNWRIWGIQAGCRHTSTTVIRSGRNGVPGPESGRGPTRPFRHGGGLLALGRLIEETLRARPSAGASTLAARTANHIRAGLPVGAMASELPNSIPRALPFPLGLPQPVP